MKHTILFILIVVLSLQVVNGQDQRILAKNDVIGLDGLLDRLDSNIKQIAHQRPTKKQESSFVPVLFHLVANSEGEGRIETEKVLRQLWTLNQEFSTTDFVFYLKDTSLNYVNSTAVYEKPSGGGGTGKMITLQEEDGQNAVNIFLPQNAATGSGNVGTVLGYYSSITDFLVVRKNQIGSGQNTLSHELGHYFSLAHPHLGWENEPWNLPDFGRQVVVKRVNGVEVELVNGSNCHESADRICDTPPDYNFGFTWDPSCRDFDLNVLDANGDLIDPMQNNFMSYFLGCTPYVFTPDQTTVMNADFNSDLRRHLRVNHIPDVEEVKEPVVLTEPLNGTFTDFYNGVEFSWEPSENASKYLLEIRSGSDILEYLVTGTAIYVQDLDPNKLYTWSVLPFNEGGTNAEKTTNILRTNDIATDVNEIEDVSEFVVYPNPLSITNPDIFIKTQANTLNHGVLSLIDMNGKEYNLNSAIQIQPGNLEFKVSLAPLKLTTGLYLLKFSTEQGNIIKKIIIN